MIQVATPYAGPRRPPLHRPRPAALAGAGALLRASLAGALLCALAACAGTEGLPGLTPPQTNVREVEDNTFPTIGTTAPSMRAPPLTPEAQQKLQHDLERLARTQDK
ncbi:hypothetical protein [Xanthobacter autotrophicus]|uniref:hypothetical protein n=1 Tax=Xanthobacter autotrophicus TaxID=280 RepID=UPI00372999C2